MEVEVYLHSFLTEALDGSGEWSVSCSGYFIPWKEQEIDFI
jgi:hypothetical protein